MVVGSPSATPAPTAATARSVARRVRRVEVAADPVGPSAIAPISAARWETDLSGGGRSSPWSGPAGSKYAVIRALETS